MTMRRVLSSEFLDSWTTKKYLLFQLNRCLWLGLKTKARSVSQSGKLYFGLDLISSIVANSNSFGYRRGCDHRLENNRPFFLSQ